MGLFSRLSALFAAAVDPSAGDDEQTEVSRATGTIWNAVLNGDLAAVKALCEHDPSVLEQRGAVGDLPLLMCFLYGHINLAMWIVSAYPATITCQYTGVEYTGENILHIAIINQDLPTVKQLLALKQPGLLTARATGVFFQHGSACYYGEYPLAFACCTNQPEIASLLLDHGADISCADSRGNTILHLLVIHNLPEMYAFVQQEYKRRVLGEGVVIEERTDGGPSTPMKKAPPAPLPPRPDVILGDRLNNDGLTPFCLSAKINSTEMFAFLLQETKQTQWTFGPVSCDLYALDQLDLAIPCEGVEARPGALELIMNEGNINLLMHPRMIDLVSQKWTKFAERIFKQRFRMILSYLVFFTVTCIVRQTVRHVQNWDVACIAAFQAGLPAPEAVSASAIPWAVFIARYPFILWAMELAVLAGAWYKGSAEFTEMWRSGVREYFSSSGSALLENTLSCVFCGCIFLVALLALIGSPAQTAVLAVASIAGWSYIFFFLLAFRLTGPMVVMIGQMLTNDVLRFCLIYLVFLMGFAQAFFVLFESVGLSGFIISIKTCFVAMLGDFELDQFADTPYTAVSVGLLVVYVVTITILLLNLLIAMMGDTYEKINEHAEMQWHLERARIIFAIENELSSEERQDPQNKYWTTVGERRFLQVLEVNPDHWQSEDDGKKKDDDAKADKD